MRLHIQPVTILIIASFFAQCDGIAMAQQPTIEKITQILDSYLPPPPETGYGDISKDVCSIVGPQELDFIIGQAFPPYDISKVRLDGVADVPSGSNMWVIKRAKPGQWSQTLGIIIQPDGKCSARLDFERYGTV